MKQYKLSTILLSIVTFLSVTGCSIDAVYYSETVPDTFFESQENVWQRFYRPFTHWKYYMGEKRFRYEMKQLGTDEMCIPQRGTNWGDNGDYQKFHEHVFSATTLNTDKTWEAITMGVAHAWETLEDLDKYVDFEAFGFPEGTRESMLNQLRALAAFYYLEGLDFFGGMPLYTTVSTPVVGRSTAQETFDFIEELLDLSIPNLPLKTQLGGFENGGLNRATGAALKMRLYFNANAYIGKDMFSECAQICRDILNGVYGNYDLEEDWTAIFGVGNEYSKEIIWALPSDHARLESYDDIIRARSHYNLKYYMGNEEIEGWNGFCLVPSLKPSGERYEYKLGSPFAKFHNDDIRKQPYAYLGGGKFRGMFMMGKQVNPLDAADDSIAEEDKRVCLGTQEYTNKVLVMVDQIAEFSKVGTPGYPANVADLPSNITTGEENSGIRLVKVAPVPDGNEKENLYNPDIPEIRLAEVYYTLAECELRMDGGNTAEAARLINQVRKRYFPNGDPDPVTSSNLDKYRMLDEWMIEFIGEQRRRTDLIRWDAYVTENWWAHTATNNPNLNRYPLHNEVRASNDLLEQNPGYGSN